MPRYFFDVYDGAVSQDDEGIELPDDEAAKKEATRAVTELAREILAGSEPRKTIHVTVRDEGHHLLFEARIDFTLHPIGPFGQLAFDQVEDHPRDT